MLTWHTIGVERLAEVMGRAATELAIQLLGGHLLTCTRWVVGGWDQSVSNTNGL